MTKATKTAMLRAEGFNAAAITLFSGSVSRARARRAEHRYELRAAFGPGVTVVNVITGKRTRT